MNRDLPSSRTRSHGHGKPKPNRRRENILKELPKKIDDWRPAVASLVKKSEPLWRRVLKEGTEMVRRVLWKHHFVPIDTSNALAWLRIPAYLVPPSRPVINHLPDELLVKIFLFVVHSDCTQPQDLHTKHIRCAITSGSSPTTPLTLGHICTMWRRIVNTSPILWSTIVVCSPEEKHLALALYWVERTGSCSLNISMEQYASPNPVCDAIAHLLVAQAHRWKRLSLVLVNDAPFIRLQPNDLPLLEEYRLRLGNWKLSRLERFVQILHSSPELKTMNWGRSLLKSNQIPSETPWIQLVDITFHNVELDGILLDALSQCQSLEILQLRLLRKPKTSTPREPLVLARVRRLVCEFSQHGSSICNTLTLPSLNDLEMYTTGLPGSKLINHVYPSVFAMVERSDCMLETLSIDNCSAILTLSRNAAFQTIESLNIFSAIRNNDFLVQMTKVHGREILFPELQHLFMETCRTTDGLLAEMLWSRRSELCSAGVCIDSTEHRKDRTMMDWLKKDGIHVNIYDPIVSYQIVNPKIQRSHCDPNGDKTCTVHLPDYEKTWR